MQVEKYDILANRKIAKAIFDNKDIVIPSEISALLNLTYTTTMNFKRYHIKDELIFAILYEDKTLVTPTAVVVNEHNTLKNIQKYSRTDLAVYFKLLVGNNIEVVIG